MLTQILARVVDNYIASRKATFIAKFIAGRIAGRIAGFFVSRIAGRIASFFAGRIAKFIARRITSLFVDLIAGVIAGRLTRRTTHWLACFIDRVIVMLHPPSLRPFPRPFPLPILLLAHRAIPPLCRHPKPRRCRCRHNNGPPSSGCSPGCTLISAADAAGVTRMTLYRWLNHDAKFQAAYNAWQQDAVLNARTKVLSMADTAVNTVGHALKTDARLAFRFLQSLGTLTHPTPGPTDPTEVAQRMRADRQKAEAKLGEDLFHASLTANFYKRPTPDPLAGAIAALEEEAG